MVTHSPELAEEYANVIVSMEDGQIKDISQNIPSENKDVPEINDNKPKSKMSILTAFKLAYRNLKLKKGRTIWTSIGMSIGIIGIALALALTSGTKTTVENQVMAIFPANTIRVFADEGESVGSSRNLTYTDYQNIKEIASDAQGVVFFPDNIMPTIVSLDKKSADIMKMQDRQETKMSTIFLLIIMVQPFSNLKILEIIG